MAIRRYYPATSHRPLTITFPERVQADKFPPVYPNTTNRLKSTPQYYQYYTKPLGFSAATFKETVHAVDMTTLDLPPKYSYRRFDTAQIKSFTNDTKPIVPMPDMPTVDSQPRIIQGRLVNYMNQYYMQAIVAGRVRNLPLLGVG